MAAIDLWRSQRQRTIPLWLPLLAAVAVAARVMVVQLDPVEKSSTLVEWVPLAYAEERAKDTGRPILYDFTAEWCRPCHVLDDEVFKDAQIAARINKRFIPVRVTDRMQEDGANPPAVQAVQRRFEVRMFPTVVIAGVDGHTRAKMVGYEGKSEFVKMIERVP